MLTSRWLVVASVVVSAGCASAAPQPPERPPAPKGEKRVSREKPPPTDTVSAVALPTELPATAEFAPLSEMKCDGGVSKPEKLVSWRDDRVPVVGVGGYWIPIETDHI